MLRSIKRANEIVHEQDADSAVTVHTIRMWCKHNKIKYLQAGSKILVDIDSLLDYINFKGENE